VDATQVVAAEHELPPAAIDPRLVPRATRRGRAIASSKSDRHCRRSSAREDAMQSRILDGICRFHSQRPVDFEKRVARFSVRRSKGTRLVLMSPVLGIPQVIRQWLELPELPRRSWWNSWARFLRIDRSDWLHGEETRPSENSLLALPTYKGGWLDPGRSSAAVELSRLKRGDWTLFVAR
jgi:hypothetical protein